MEDQERKKHKTQTEGIGRAVEDGSTPRSILRPLSHLAPSLFERCIERRLGAREKKLKKKIHEERQRDHEEAAELSKAHDSFQFLRFVPSLSSMARSIETEESGKRKAKEKTTAVLQQNHEKKQDLRWNRIGSTR